MSSYQLSSSSVSGIAGAGSILFGDGLAHFSLFASRLAGMPELPSDTAVPLVRVQWRDPQAELTLESTSTVFYGPLEGVDGGRGIAGTMRANGADEYFFVMSSVAANTLGEGQESVAISVGDAITEDPTLGFDVQPSGFTYAANGQLLSGDLQLLDIDMAQQIIQQTTP